MRPSAPLPEPFDGRAFRVRDAREAGVSRGRLRGRDLESPYFGVRATRIASIEELAAAYATVMPSHQVYGGITAARLWGLPLARPWTRDEPLVIARSHRTTRGRAKGTRHISVHPTLSRAAQHDLPVLEPAATALTLARELDHEALVQVVDALLTPSSLFPGLALPQAPYLSAASMFEFAQRCRKLDGGEALLAAVGDARVGVDSRFETITRLLIVEAGLPEPLVHPLVVIEGIELHPDLGYPELKVAVEYEGDGHLDARRRDRDIDRYSRLEAAGWIVVPVRKGDLGRRGARFLARLRAALARRG